MLFLLCVVGPRRVNHASVAISDFIYSFGGYCSGEDYRSSRSMDVHVLNTNNLRWTLLPIDKDLKYPKVPFQRYGELEDDDAKADIYAKFLEIKVLSVKFSQSSLLSNYDSDRVSCSEKFTEPIQSRQTLRTVDELIKITSLRSRLIDNKLNIFVQFLHSNCSER